VSVWRFERLLDTVVDFILGKEHLRRRRDNTVHAGSTLKDLGSALERDA
jgi:hypothetical protein